MLFALVNKYQSFLLRGFLVRKYSLFWLSVLLLSLVGCATGPNVDLNTNGVAVDGLPPDPGLAGKTTVEGVDSNNNGVRDDVERFIVLEFPDLKPVEREFLFYTAMSLQDAILLGARTGDSLAEDEYYSLRLEAQEIAEQTEETDTFFWYIFGAYANPQGTNQALTTECYDISTRVESALTDSPERVMAYAKYNGLLSGLSFKGPDRKKLDSLEQKYRSFYFDRHHGTLTPQDWRPE